MTLAARSRVAFLVLLSFAGSGCIMSSTQVRPTELPKLNNSSVDHVGRSGNADIYLVTSAQLLTPQGKLVKIEGEAGIGIEANGRSTIFEHPVHTELEDDILTIRSKNLPETTFTLDEIHAAYARTPSAWNGVLAGVGGAAVGLLLGLIIIETI